MRVKFIKGKKIFLSPLTEEDAKDCYYWFLNPNINKFLSSKTIPNTIEKSKEYIKSANSSNNSILLGIFCINSNEEYIGNIELQSIDFLNRNAALSIVIGNEKYLGLGFGTEAINLILKYAFLDLNLNMIYLNVFVNNKRAIKAYKKVGFKKCGIVPECFFKDDKFIDCIVMAITKSEYINLLNKEQKAN